MTRNVSKNSNRVNTFYSLICPLYWHQPQRSFTLLDLHRAINTTSSLDLVLSCGAFLKDYNILAVGNMKQVLYPKKSPYKTSSVKEIVGKKFVFATTTPIYEKGDKFNLLK